MSISNIVNEHTSLGWVCTRNNVNNIEGNKFALNIKIYFILYSGFNCETVPPYSNIVHNKN